MHISRIDFDRFVKLLPDFYVTQDLESLPRHLISLVPQLIAVDTCGYNEINIEQRRIKVRIEPSPEYFGVKDFNATARATLHEHPLVDHYGRTRDTRALKLSDFASRRSLRRLRLYNEIFRPMGIEYLMTVSAKTAQTDDHIALSLSRERSDFSERDGQMLEMLRPHFLQAFLNAKAVSAARQDQQETQEALEGCLGATTIRVRDGQIISASPRAIDLLEKYAGAMSPANRLPDVIARRWRYWQESLADRHCWPSPIAPMTIKGAEGAHLIVRILPRRSEGYLLLLTEQTERDNPALLARHLGLSPREAEVLLWVARGKTSAEVASIMDLSRRTVDKHLERIYPKLGVESRVAAASVAWDALRRTSRGGI